MARRKVPLVFFNASVIIAGLRSPSGGSGKLLQWVRMRRIAGVVSEIVVDEVLRHAEKIGMSQAMVRKRLKVIFPFVAAAPEKTSVDKYKPMVLDHGDAHLLASAEQAAAEVLVSLDRKHILSLKTKALSFRITSPKELIERVQ